MTAAFDRHSWAGALVASPSRARGAWSQSACRNAHLTEAVGSLGPGVALDAGCGHGAEALWLAARGWQVAAVVFSKSALAHARSTAGVIGADVAERVDWVEGDLATCALRPGRYDLVACLYVHVAVAMEEMVQRDCDGGRARREACS
ncbi:class I SAM-dependent methyltransferase [Streptomyces sp. RPT161]|uniref:class I SAM-dependent methyltransferase n=1 Tax=Streptomyces sp. RPT161 TaxID=3015993 RepID=UPI0022B89A4B|nr:class I SAM-dependent methyltransferase [Streptomyces sp. RPT161]